MSENGTIPKRTLGTATIDPTATSGSAPVVGEGERARLAQENREDQRARVRRFRKNQPRAWRMGDSEIHEHFDRMDNDDVYRRQHETKELGHEFMSSVRSSNVTRPRTGRTVNEIMGDLSQMQRTTMMMMMSQMMRYNPMNGGARDPKMLLQGVTTGALFMALSPDFREMVGAGRQQIISTITDRLDARIDRKKLRIDAKAKARIDRYERALAGDFKGSEMTGLRLRFQALGGDPEKEDRLIARWAKRLDALRDAERDGRPIILDNATAAMTKLGVCENAYEMMRERDKKGRLINDPDEVMARYEEVITEFDRRCEADGLSVDDVDRSMRMLVGERLAEEFDFQDRIHGPSHGQVRMDEEKPVRGLDGKMRYAWTGDFVDTGGQDPKERWFAPRAPQSASEHVARLSHSMFYDALSVDDLAEKQRVLSVFARASSMHNDEMFSQLVSSEREDLASPEFTLTKQAVAFQRCMKQDGFTDAEIYRAYGKALENAAESTFEQSPKLRQMMEASEDFGTRWHVTGSPANSAMRARMREEVQDSVPHRVSLGEDLPDRTEERTQGAEGDRAAESTSHSESYVDRPDREQLREESRQERRNRSSESKRGPSRIRDAMRGLVSRTDVEDTQEDTQETTSQPQRHKRPGDASERARAATKRLEQTEQQIREVQDERLREAGWDPVEVRMRQRMEAQRQAAQKDRTRRVGERIRRIDREQRLRDQQMYGPSL